MAKKKTKPKKEKRKKARGPAYRGIWGRLFSKKKRFGKGVFYDFMPETLSMYGDPAIKPENVGKAIEKARGKDPKRFQRLIDAVTMGTNYYGPQYAELRKGSELYNAFRKRVKVREGDVISITRSVSNRPGFEVPVEDVWISAKSPEGKGERFFRLDFLSDPKLHGEASSFLIEAITEGKIKLLPNETEPFRRATALLKDNLRKIVKSFGRPGKGGTISVNVSDIEKSFGKEHQVDPELAVPELRRLAKELISGKKIVVKEKKKPK